MLFYKAHPKQPSSLVTAPTENHRKWRRITAPAFSDKSLKAQEPLVMQYVDLLITRLKDKAGDGEIVELTAWYNWATFDIIGNLAWGDSFGCLAEARYHPFIDRVSKSLRRSSRLVLIRYMGLHRLTYFALSILFRKGFVTRDIGGDTLKKRVANKEPRPDLLEPLIHARDEGLLDQATLSTMAAGFLLAGSETTASALSGVTWLLLSNPEKLEKLVREVREAFRDESEINFSSVQKLEYTLACLNESLRLYPPVAMGMPREVPKGGAVISGGYTVVSVYQFSTNHLSSNWTDPFEFAPERFLGDGKFRQDKQASMKPFHVGPRDCLGKSLAYAEMRVILAPIIWNFDMKLVGGSVDWIASQKHYILWDKLPLEVVLTPIKR